jgi:hypothetical protein
MHNGAERGVRSQPLTPPETKVAPGERERWYIEEVFVAGKCHVVWDRIQTRVDIFSSTAIIILT